MNQQPFGNTVLQALSATKAAIERVSELRGLIPQLMQERQDKVIHAPLNRAGWTQLMMLSLDIRERTAEGFLLSSAQKYLPSAKLMDDALNPPANYMHPLSLFQTNWSGSGDVSACAAAFYFRELVEAGIERLAEKMKFPPHAISYEERNSRLEKINQQIDDLTKELHDLEEALDAAGFQKKPKQAGRVISG